MKYVSTRNKSIRRSFEEALFSGYSPDGGLFVPENLPKISSPELQSYASLSFPSLAYEVVRAFISPEEVSDDDLRIICEKSFHDGFDAPDDGVVPVVPVGSVYVAELFHGPTFCFKDLGMRGVINLLSHFSAKRHRKTTLLAATTGDTGPAAVHAVANSNNPYLGIVVHYPRGQISAFQRKQMTTVDSPMVAVVSFDGGGDDMDRPIKDLLTEQQRQHQQEESRGDTTADRILCGVNSYNIGRPLMQMVHFFWTYLRVCEQLGKEPGEDTIVDIVIPTGAMGNMCAGYMAKNMGLPIGKLCAGTNPNDITHRAIQTGKFHRADEMEQTLSEAINIQVPYNFERILYFLTGHDDALVRQWMTTMDTTAKLDIDSTWLDKLQRNFCSARITDEEMCQVMVRVKEGLGYFVDPHTAVAFAAADKLGYHPIQENAQRKPVVIFATASPCKFQEAVTVALGEEGWAEYENAAFPDRARELITKDEVQPTEYKWQEGCTLEEVQTSWKKNVIELVDSMGGV